MKDNTSGGALTETSLLILLGFCGCSYGYGVMQWIKKVTNNRVDLGMGTLYGAINSMLERGWLKEKEQIGRRKIYCATEQGVEQIHLEVMRLEEILQITKETIKLKGGEEYEKD